MNVYIETNFLLEIAFAQEQDLSCRQIVELGQQTKIKLILPSFSIAESIEKLIRSQSARNRIQREIKDELDQLARSSFYQADTQAARVVIDLLVRSSEEDLSRFDVTVAELLNMVELVPIDAQLVASAKNLRSAHKLAMQDAIVYASVLNHLTELSHVASCFLNRDKHFTNPDIIENLERRNCKTLFSFARGLDYIRYKILPSARN